LHKLAIPTKATRPKQQQRGNGIAASTPQTDPTTRNQHKLLAPAQLFSVRTNTQYYETHMQRLPNMTDNF